MVARPKDVESWYNAFVIGAAQIKLSSTEKEGMCHRGAEIGVDVMGALSSKKCQIKRSCGIPPTHSVLHVNHPHSTTMESDWPVGTSIQCRLWRDWAHHV